eukprot:gene7729-8540_t
MDRGRAGGFVTDNNYFGTRLKKKQLRDHKLRLEKIMRRKPGTSVTLDNAPPQVMRGSVVLNPRKEALKEHLNQVTEKENKSLLKRISLILTAPPKITEKDYLDMKKLCKSQKNDPRAQFERDLQQQKVSSFFRHLHHTGSYYDPRQWEEDYRVQKKNQRFMRQVKYRRRPGSVLDPLRSGPSSPASQLGASSETTRPWRSTAVGSSAHIHRVRARRHTSSSEMFGSLAASRSSESEVSTLSPLNPAESQQEEEQQEQEEGRADDDRDAFAYYYRDGRVEIASVDRPIRLSYPSDVLEAELSLSESSAWPDWLINLARASSMSRKASRVAEDHSSSLEMPLIEKQVEESGEEEAEEEQEEEEDGHWIPGRVSCFLLKDQGCILIAAEATYHVLPVHHHLGGGGGGGGSNNSVASAAGLSSVVLSAEAEISFENLKVIADWSADEDAYRNSEAGVLGDGGGGGGGLGGLDVETIKDLAQEIIDNVELRQESPSETRLLLSLVNEQRSMASGSCTTEGVSDGESVGAGEGLLGRESASPFPANPNEEEILLPDPPTTVLSAGCRVTVHYTLFSSALSPPPSLTTLIGGVARASGGPGIGSKPEVLHALCRVCLSPSEDSLTCSALIAQASSQSYKKGTRTRPAVPHGTMLTLTAALPSVVQADSDLIVSFAENLLQGLKVEHDCRTGENMLVLASSSSSTT